MTEDTPHYSEGIMGDGAAILCDGEPMTISEVLAALNGKTGHAETKCGDCRFSKASITGYGGDYGRCYWVTETDSPKPRWLRPVAEDQTEIVCLSVDLGCSAWESRVKEKSK